MSAAVRPLLAFLPSRSGLGPCAEPAQGDVVDSGWEYAEMKLYENLLSAAREEPEAIALEFMGMQFPYFLVAHDARRVAAGLVALGLKPGDSVGCMLPNIPQFVAVYYGALMAGCVFVPMNVMLLGPEVEYVVRDSNIKALVTYEMFAEQASAGIAKLENPPTLFVVGANTAGHKSYAELMGDGESFTPVDVDTNLPVMRLYTSGTTGKPKGAEITNANVIANLEMFESILPYEKGDKALCVLPLFHCFALNGVLNASVRHRTAVVLHPKFELEAAFKSLADDGIASFAGVPTMFFYLLKHPAMGKTKFPKLRYCISGGAAMPVEVINQFESITGVPIYEGFGLTETTVSVCINRPDCRKIGSIGQPFDGVEMKIFDEQDQEVACGEVGEVVIRGPNVMLGYLNRPEETAEALRNGWFHTGDLGLRRRRLLLYRRSQEGHDHQGGIQYLSPRDRGSDLPASAGGRSGRDWRLRRVQGRAHRGADLLQARPAVDA